MEELTYSYITEFIKKQSFPEAAAGDNIVNMQGQTFLNDERFKHYCRILNSRVEKPSKVPCIFNAQELEKRINCEKKLTARLTSLERFNLFVLIVQKCIDQETGIPVNGYLPQIERLSVVLDIDRNDFNAILTFFGSIEPYNDLKDTIYYAPEKSNRLVAAKGINVHFNLKEDDQIYYFKYFRGYELFLSKTFNYRRPNNSITANISVKEINYLHESNSTLFKSNISPYPELVESVSKHLPFQTVRVEATSSTPAIFLDAALSRIIIRGTSSPLSPINYFQPVYEWINNYEAHGSEYLEIHFLFEYFNSYTSKFILNLTNMCKSLCIAGREIKCFWYYKEEDDEMKDFGKHLKAIFGNDFKLILLDKSPEILV